MKNPVPNKTPVRNPFGGNGHRTVWARLISSGTPRLRIAATRFFLKSIA
jgi:hypothetical protein